MKVVRWRITVDKYEKDDKSGFIIACATEKGRNELTAK